MAATDPATESSDSAARPEFQRIGLGYHYTPTRDNGRPLGIVLRARYLHRHGETVSAELTLETTTGVLLDTGTRHNLTSLQTRQTIIKHFRSLGLPDISDDDWQRVMVTFCASVLAAERRPARAIDVGRNPRLPAGQRFLLYPLVAEGKLNGIHGPGGSGKGYVATLAAVLVQSGTEACGLRPKPTNVLYLDWEEVDDPIGLTINERVAAVSAGLGIEPPVIGYMECRRPLRADIENIAHVVDQRGARFLVIDSVEMAMGAGDDDASYQSRIIGLIEAIRELGPVTCLLIDHVSAATARADRTPGQVSHAFGSVFKHNEIRWSWEVTAQQEVDDPHLHVALLHDKRNNGGRLSPVGLDIDFSDPGTVVIRRENVAETSQATRLENYIRIKWILTHSDHPLSVAEIHEEMSDIQEATVRKTLNRYKGRLFVHLKDGRWAAAPRDGSPGNGRRHTDIPRAIQEAFAEQSLDDDHVSGGGDEPDPEDDLDDIPF